MAVTPQTAQAGDELPPLKLAPISRHTLALYCGASGDHNPIHVDIDFAKKFGYDDVFAHGMLSMAYLSRLLIGWAKQSQVRDYGVRFTALTNVHDEIICTGKVVEVANENGEEVLKLAIQTAKQDGTVTLTGTATIARA